MPAKTMFLLTLVKKAILNVKLLIKLVGSTLKLAVFGKLAVVTVDHLLVHEAV